MDERSIAGLEIDMRRLKNAVATWLFAVVVSVPAARAQDAAKAPAPQFKPEELEAIVAPIALYPDALLAQVLMASTYPLEIVEAARWSKANPGLKEQALQDALQKQSWDPSVKSLAAFPTVLQMMNEKLDMTQKLGDAFLGQQKDVMDAVQRLRAKAEAAGNLKSGKEQTVATEQDGNTTIIKIEPTQPDVVYVPSYSSMVVYGPWPYPMYPPYYYPPPPGYAPGGDLLRIHRGHYHRLGLGPLQLARRQREHQRQQLQPRQPHQHQQRELAAQPGAP